MTKAKQTTFTFQLSASAKRRLREQARAAGVKPGELVRQSLAMLEQGFLPVPIAGLLPAIQKAGETAIEADPAMRAWVDSLRAQGDSMALERITTFGLIRTALQALDAGLIPVSVARELVAEMAERLAAEDPAVDTEALLIWFEKGLESRRQPVLN